MKRPAPSNLGRRGGRPRYAGGTWPLKWPLCQVVETPQDKTTMEMGMSTW